MERINSTLINPPKIRGQRKNKVAQMVCTKIKEIQSKIHDAQLNVDWIHLSKTKIIRLDFKK